MCFQGESSASTYSGSSNTGSGTSSSTNRIPDKIKINDVWYDNIREECTGEVKIRKGAGDPVEYTARKPNPILHSNYYHIYDTYGNKVGEFNTN
ncbi:hypothetical protein FACS189454_02640 [Planctomycetales bacterium]|nr:hypothetical protein FACS189454_02640 [Planctomycetales bacterium]